MNPCEGAEASGSKPLGERLFAAVRKKVCWKQFARSLSVRWRECRPITSLSALNAAMLKSFRKLLLAAKIDDQSRSYSTFLRILP